MKYLITEAVKKYSGNSPEIYEAGMRDGFRLAIEFLKICSGVESELCPQTTKENTPS